MALLFRYSRLTWRILWLEFYYCNCSYFLFSFYIIFYFLFIFLWKNAFFLFSVISVVRNISLLTNLFTYLPYYVWNYRYTIQGHCDVSPIFFTTIDFLLKTSASSVILFARRRCQATGYEMQKLFIFKTLHVLYTWNPVHGPRLTMRRFHKVIFHFTSLFC